MITVKVNVVKFLYKRIQPISAGVNTLLMTVGFISEDHSVSDYNQTGLVSNIFCALSSILIYQLFAHKL